MTEAERIELLREVARCAPEGMGATFDHESVVNFHAYDDGDGYPQLGLKDELCDASGCFAMLDAMECRDLGGIGPSVLVELIGGDREYRCRRWVCPENDGAMATTDEGGATRAEAVSRAFVAVFSQVKR